MVANVPGVVWEAYGEPDKNHQRIDFVSQYVEKLLGYTVEEWLSEPNFWLKIVHKDDKKRAAAEAAKIFAGKKGGISQFRWLAKNGKEIWVEAQSTVICDSDGNPIGMRGVTMDITERKKLELSLVAEKEKTEKINRNLEYIAKTNQILSTSLNYKTTLDRLVKLCVPKLSDWCAVDILEENKIKLFAVAHSDPKKIAWARKYRKTTNPDVKAETGVPKVIKTGVSDFYPEITDEMIEAAVKNKKELNLIRYIGFRSLMIVPIRGQNKIYGAITFVSSKKTRLYNQEDLLFAEEMGRKAGTAVERAKLHEEIRSSRDNLKGILKNITEGITVQNPDGKLLFANEAAAKISGFESAKELLDTPNEKIIKRFEIYDENDHPLTVLDLPGRQALQGHFGRKVVKFKILATGEERYSEVLANPVFNKNGKIKFAINVFRDISENIKSQEAIKVSEEKWRSVVQNAPDYIFTVDRKHRIQFINRVAKGISEKEVLGSPIFNFIPKQYHQIAKRAINNTFKTGSPGIYEVEGTGADGKTSWYRSRTGPIKDIRGKVIAVTIISSDITDFKLAQEIIQQAQRSLEKKVFERTRQLQNSVENLKKEIKKREKIEKELIREKEFTEKLINTNLVGVLAFDKKFRYTVWNPGMEIISGLKAKDVVGRNAFKVFPFLKETGESKHFYSALKGGISVSRDQEYNIPKTDKKGFFDAYYSPIKNIQGKVEGGLVFIRDITERKQIEDAKYLALKELERAKSEFVSMASHELRTPLTIINGYFDLLVNGDLGDFSDATSNFQMYIDKMYRETKRLSKLVEDLLNTSRIEDGRIKLYFERLHLPEVLNEVVSELKPIAKNKGISITSVNKLNGLSTQALVYADRDKLKQIFVNLVDNAICYNKPNGKVVVKTFSRDEKIYVEVRDTGIGINEELIPRIFQKFQQAHGSYLKENKGTGLGLFIVKSLVELQNGQIAVKSRSGKGTSFIVNLPLKNPKRLLN